MIRVAFTLLGGANWTGGHNYLLNLLRVLSAEYSHRISPVLFVGDEKDDQYVSSFREIQGLEIIRTPLLNPRRRKSSLLLALLWGRDTGLKKLFDAEGIQLVFEAAQFFGWRLGLPVIAWIPDFQHLSLPDMFTATARWKREIGFRAQVYGRRSIMLSSEDARQLCLANYPVKPERTCTVHFAVPAGPGIDYSEARAAADQYELPAVFFYMPNQLWKHKNHKLVVDALALLRRRGMPMVVAASGKQHDPRDPTLFTRLKAQADRLGVAQDIRFLGLIPYPHLAALMRASSALINPSLSEGWSTTVEEARAMGVPMLLSDLEVHREQMGEKAFYFERQSASSLADALQRFQPLEQSQRQAMIDSAQESAGQRVSRFGDDFTRLVEICVRQGNRQ